MASRTDIGTETDLQNESPAVIRKTRTRKRKIRNTDELKIDQTLGGDSDVEYKKTTEKTRMKENKALLPKINMDFNDFSKEIEESTSSEPEKVVKKKSRKKKRSSKDKENSSETETETKIRARRGRSKKTSTCEEEIKTVFVNDKSSNEEGNLPESETDTETKIRMCRGRSKKTSPCKEEIKTVFVNDKSSNEEGSSPEKLKISRKSFSSKKSQSILKVRRSRSLEKGLSTRKSVRFYSIQPNVKRIRHETYDKDKEENLNEENEQSLEIIDITSPDEVRRKISLRNVTPAIKRTSKVEIVEITDSPMEERRSLRTTAVKLFSDENPPQKLQRQSTFTKEDTPKKAKTPLKKGKFVRQSAFTNEELPKKIERQSTFTKEDSPKKAKTPLKAKLVKQSTNEESSRKSTVEKKTALAILESPKLTRSSTFTETKFDEKPALRRSLTFLNSPPVMKNKRKTWNIPSTSEFKSGLLVEEKIPRRKTWNKEPTEVVIKQSVTKTPLAKTPRKSTVVTPGTSRTSLFKKESPRKSTAVTPGRSRTSLFKKESPRKSTAVTPGRSRTSLLKKESPKRPKTPKSTRKSVVTKTPGNLVKESPNRLTERLSSSFTVGGAIAKTPDEPKRLSRSFTIASGDMEDNFVKEDFVTSRGQRSAGFKVKMEDEILSPSLQSPPGPLTRPPSPSTRRSKKSSSFTIGDVQTALKETKRKSSSFSVALGVSESVLLGLDDSIKLLGGDLTKVKTPQRALKDSGEALNVSRHVTPFLRRLKANIQTPPSGTSTPRESKKNKIIKHVETRLLVNNMTTDNFSAGLGTSKNKTRTKIPNFALIHQRALNKVEDIKEMQERKNERAKLLLSGKKPPLGLGNTPSFKQSKKNLQFNQGSSSEQTDYTGTPKAGRKNIANISQIPLTSKNIINEIRNAPISKPVSLRSHIPVSKQLPTSRYGFKATTKDQEKKSVASKSRPAKNFIEQRRNVLNGVRSNRRFELLMAMRMKK